MRRTPLLLPLALLAACGSSAAPPPLFGGFVPQGAAVVRFAPTTCDIPFVSSTTSASALGIALTSFADACGFVTATHLCGSRQSSTLLLALAVDGVPNGTAAALAPGTYPFVADPPTGPFAAATASAVQTDASCGALPGTSHHMSGGHITVTSITATHVVGSLDLRFDDGSSYQQPLDLDLCDVAVDLCSLLEFGGCTSSFQCLP